LPGSGIAREMFMHLTHKSVGVYFSQAREGEMSKPANVRLWIVIGLGMGVLAVLTACYMLWSYLEPRL
jgi:hypothetical protein